MIDLQPVLAAQPDRVGLFFQRNVHLTPRGHEVVADALSRFPDDAAGCDAQRALMVFNSLHFVGFFLVVYALYRALPHRAQNWMLVAASYYFYAAWDWRFLGLLIGSTVIDFAVARYLGRTRRARAGAARRSSLSLVFNLGDARVLQVLQLLRDEPGAPARRGSAGIADAVTLHVILPIGISFYTFMTMSYVIDVYRRRDPAGDATSSTSRCSSRTSRIWWPGPILRASLLLPQIARPRTITREQIVEGLWLIAWGYFQKIFVADNLADLVDAVFDPSATPNGARRAASRSTRSRFRSTATSPATRTSRAACRS